MFFLLPNHLLCFVFFNFVRYNHGGWGKPHSGGELQRSSAAFGWSDIEIERQVIAEKNYKTT